MKFEGDEMEGKLYILQLYYSYRVLINILNIMIAVYKNLHIAWYEQSHERRTRLGQDSSRCFLIESMTMWV